MFDSEALLYWRSPSASTAARPAFTSMSDVYRWRQRSRCLPRCEAGIARSAGDVAGRGDHRILRAAAGAQAAAAGSTATSANTTGRASGWLWGVWASCQISSTRP